MDRIWFIFHKDHHKGPFLKEEIITMFHEKRVSLDSLIWRAGSPGWKSLKDWNEFYYILKEILDLTDFPPPPPPTPDNDISNTKVEPLPPITDIYKEQTQHQIESYDAKFNRIESITGSEISQVSIIEKIKNKLQTIIGVVGAIIFVTSLLMIIFSKDKEINIQGVNQVDYRRLNQLVEDKVFDNVRFGFALSTSGDEIFVSTNQEAKGSIYLSLNSIDGKIISEGKVSIQSKSFLNSNYAKFSKLNFIKGTKIIPGYYLAKINGVKDTLTSKLLGFLGKIDYLRNFDFIENFSSKYNYQGVVLLVSGNIAKFKKKLKSFNVGIKNQKIKKIQEILESYTTYKALLQKLGEAYNEVMKNIKRGKEIRKLELKYFSEIGPVLEGMVMHNYDQNILELSKGKVDAEEHKKLLEFGKKIGALSSEMISKTKSYKRINKVERVFLLQTYDEKIELLLSIVDVRIARFQKKKNSLIDWYKKISK